MKLSFQLTKHAGSFTSANANARGSSESTLRNPTYEGYKSLVRAFKRKRSDDTYNEQRRERRRIEREKKGSDT